MMHFVGSASIFFFCTFLETFTVIYCSYYADTLSDIADELLLVFERVAYASISVNHLPKKKEVNEKQTVYFILNDE